MGCFGGSNLSCSRLNLGTGDELGITAFLFMPVYNSVPGDDLHIRLALKR
jgi:hypothetical protein